MPRKSAKRARAKPEPKKLSPAELRRRRAVARERERRAKARARAEAVERRKRSAAARKGWETRRKNERERSERSRKGWRTRYFRQAREEAADGLRGAKRADWKVLVAMIDNEDPAWVAFITRAEQLGFSTRQARDEWFSPTIQ